MLSRQPVGRRRYKLMADDTDGRDARRSIKITPAECAKRASFLLLKYRFNY